ncbi:MAG: type II secretion system GspH family protein [Candidatus Hydrogenedentes bacterium]|nr:type II secretion system GspH family protein [Candidatus Hydrogenedentota bacterium]
MYRNILIKSKREKQERGMTLVELMFAAGILAFVLSMVFTSVVGVGMNREIHTEQLLADSIVNELLDQISTMSRDQLLTFRPNINVAPGINPHLSIEVVGSNGNTIALPLTNQNITLPNPAEVRVTLRWQTTRGITITKRGSTYVAN